MNRALAAVVGAVTGTVVGAGTYALVVPDAVLAGGVSVVYGLAAALTGAYWPALRRHRYPSAAGWYAGLWAVVVTGAALFGVGSVVTDPGRRYALGVLVIGVGYASYLIGTVGERAAGTRTGPPPGET